MVQKPFKSSTAPGVKYKAFELLHFDIFGPMEQPSRSGSKYVLMVVDEFSGVVLNALFGDEAVIARIDNKEKVRKLTQLLRHDSFWLRAKQVDSLTTPVHQSLGTGHKLWIVPGYATSSVKCASVLLRGGHSSKRRHWRLDTPKPITGFVGDGVRQAVNSATELANALRISGAIDVTRDLLYADMMSFVRQKTLWTESDLMENSQHPSLYWWLMSSDFPALKPLADRIFPMPASSASSKRSWSTHGYIHTKKRSRLEPSRVETLVFVYSNSGEKVASKRAYYGQPEEGAEYSKDSDGSIDAFE
ncbi:TPA: hypothetical protein N0F65_003637 [Lagenidium giganteum]|uniref:HAT C-terminal dimerisation domain-containing protein n=1 Tax=Lagenidium giganteum TaxID=4803 RepID=A0AAV2YLJ2_9STRA|nr:TPA: hypothetical protein N0F65_003637 [Lagenidium giganteum]